MKKIYQHRNDMCQMQYFERTSTLAPLDPFTIFVAKSLFMLPKIQKKVKQQNQKQFNQFKNTL